jgi:hypothetical protein
MRAPRSAAGPCRLSMGCRHDSAVGLCWLVVFDPLRIFGEITGISQKPQRSDDPPTPVCRSNSKQSWLG